MTKFLNAFTKKITKKITKKEKTNLPQTESQDGKLSNLEINIFKNDFEGIYGKQPNQCQIDKWIEIETVLNQHAK